MSRIFPPWKSHITTQLNANIEKLGPSAAYVSLATVRPDKTAANRMVVFRGFAGESHDEETGYESDILTITTAKRSHKMRELAANPSAEICWWMGGTQEQFRVTGKVYTVTDEHTPDDELDGAVTPKKDIPEPVTHQENISLATRAFWKKLETGASIWEAERLRQWYRMNDHLRATFTKACPPQLEIYDMDPHTGMPVNGKDQALLDEGYSNFALLLVQVDQVDYVDLPTGAHEIYRIKDGQWVKDKMN